MPLKIRDDEKVLFDKLRDGDPLLGVLDILGKLVRHGDDNTHTMLIDKFKDKLDMGEGAGWRMLARYGSGDIQMRLIEEFPEKLDMKGPYINAGWLILAVHGTAEVRAVLMDKHAAKLEAKEQIWEKLEDGSYKKKTKVVGPGWEAIARTGPEETIIKMVKEHSKKLDRNGGMVWHILARHESEGIRELAKLRRSITAPENTASS